ncbi:MAG: hypothetical protein IT378_14675 [Sandaracinaceae bacterium]|nr:hypothetical protein [Sandaracinaceae bacterium]
MARSKREKKKSERQAALEVDRELERQRLSRASRLKWVAIALPVVTLAAALGAYFAAGDRQLAGLVGLIGVALWVPALLGAIGAAITPRDRTRAGSIDFGSRGR